MLFAVILDPDFRPQRVQILGTTALLSSCLFLVVFFCFFCFELILTDVNTQFFLYFSTGQVN